MLAKMSRNRFVLMTASPDTMPRYSVTDRPSTPSVVVIIIRQRLPWNRISGINRRGGNNRVTAGRGRPSGCDAGPRQTRHRDTPVPCSRTDIDHADTPTIMSIDGLFFCSSYPFQSWIEISLRLL